MKKPAIKAGLLLIAFVAMATVQHKVLASDMPDNFNLGDIEITSKHQDQADGEGQVLGESTEELSQTENTASVEEAPQPVVVTVAKGDSLSKIAKDHNTTYKRLFDANETIADPNVINPGDEIRIPAENEELASRPLPEKAQPKPATTTRAKQSTVPKSQPQQSAARMVNDGSVWYQLALCESGGRPNAVSASGSYHGLYQFLPGTWRSVGGSGLPSQASAEEQTMRAQMLQARSGWGQWPACAKKLGLL